MTRRLVAAAAAVAVVLVGVTPAGAAPGNCLHWIFTFVGWAGYYPIYGWVWGC